MKRELNLNGKCVNDEFTEFEGIEIGGEEGGTDDVIAFLVGFAFGVSVLIRKQTC